MAGKQGAKPVAWVSAREPGHHLVAMQRDWVHIEIEGPKFNEYLQHEGLKNPLAARAKRDASARVGRERYSRYLKCLLRVGAKRDEPFGCRLGHRLDVVPQTNPYAHQAGDTLRALVLFEGKPLPGAQVVVYHRTGERVAQQRVTTGKRGVATVTQPGTAKYLLAVSPNVPCATVSERVRGARTRTESPRCPSSGRCGSTRRPRWGALQTGNPTPGPGCARGSQTRLV